MAEQQTVGDSDAHHEERRRKSLAPFAAGHSGAVALRIHSPPLKIKAEPLWKDGAVSTAGELANLVETLPGILLALQPLRALRFGFLHLLAHHSSQTKNPPA